MEDQAESVLPKDLDKEQWAEPKWDRQEGDSEINQWNGDQIQVEIIDRAELDF